MWLLHYAGEDLHLRLVPSDFMIGTKPIRMRIQAMESESPATSAPGFRLAGALLRPARAAVHMAIPPVITHGIQAWAPIKEPKDHFVSVVGGDPINRD
ncbi:hypothetical protein ACM7M3_29020 [Pseudomonas aeruginosa]